MTRCAGGGGYRRGHSSGRALPGARSPIGARQRGTVIIVALVLLIVTSAMLGGLMRTRLADRQRTGLDERLAQATWLAVSGLERAAARLVADPAYDGEDWSIPAEELDGRTPAVVRITVGPVSGADGQRLVTARAELGDGPGRRATRTRSARIVVGVRAGSDVRSGNQTHTGAGPEAAPEEER